MKFTIAFSVLAAVMSVWPLPFTIAQGGNIAETTDIPNDQPLPGSQKPVGHGTCIDVILNGKFSDIDNGALADWNIPPDLTNHCQVVQNDGTAIMPLGTGAIAVQVDPIADGYDALTVPDQGSKLNQKCGLEQDITHTLPGAITYAQLSWIDRITTQGNDYYDDQFAEILVTVMDNNPSTPDVDTPVFTTTTDNTPIGPVLRRLRKADITSLLSGMVVNNVLQLKLTLVEQAVKEPLYFQWDNVELFVCSTGSSPDPKPHGGGDPHFLTWGGRKFSYHGACDMVLLHSDKFNDGMGMDIHIRTKHRGQFSYISTAALRIGDEILEVTGRDKTHYLNGVANVPMPATISGFPITHKVVNAHQSTYLVHAHKQTVVIKTYHDFVSVSIEHSYDGSFADAVGFMGDYKTGKMLGRDGVTEYGDDNLHGYALDWQVRQDELKLFQTVQTPQYPQECMLPPVGKESSRRRLGEGITEETAKAACAHLDDPSDIEFCIYDVMVTNDMNSASAY